MKQAAATKPRIAITGIATRIYAAGCSERNSFTAESKASKVFINSTTSWAITNNSKHSIIIFIKLFQREKHSLQATITELKEEKNPFLLIFSAEI